MEVMVKTADKSYVGHLNQIVEEQESAASEAKAHDDSSEQRMIAKKAIEDMANSDTFDEGLDTSLLEEADTTIAETPKKGGLLNKFKNMFRGKELSPEEQKAKDLAKWKETIMDLTHIKSVDTGLGMANISGGIDFKQSPVIVEKLKDLVDLNKKIQGARGGDAVQMTQQKRQLITDINKIGLREIENKYRQSA
jgi:hypothetical protein